MAEESQEKVLSRPVAYGLLATAAAGTTALAIGAPSALAAGAGSVGVSSAVFITPVWRFIKKLNDLYVDTGMYLNADREKFRNRFTSKPKSTAAQDALAAYKPVFSRAGSYSVLGATALSVGFLGFFAPVVLATAVGSIAVSGASFTTPVIELVEKVNVAYRDTYNYLRKDILRFLPKLPDLLPVEKNTEIDQSIYAPITQREKPMSRLKTYSLLAATVAGGALLAVAAPSVLIAAAGTIIGSAISYTAPALGLVKKLNSVYEKAEQHVVDDLDLTKALGVNSPALNTAPKQEGLTKLINKPVAWVMTGAAVVGTLALAVYAPTFLTAAAGGILGSASSFTTPVLKQVGRVNAYYLHLKQRLKEDWKIVAGRKPKEAAPTKEPAPVIKIDHTRIPGPEVKPADLDKVDLQEAFRIRAKIPANEDNKPAKDVQAQPAQHGSRPGPVNPSV